MQQLFRLLVLRMSVLMGAYTVCRLIFWLLNQHYLAPASASDLALALVHGLRFDAAALSIVNLPLILLSLIPLGFVRNKHYQRGLRTAFLVLNIPFLWLNLIDSAYFDFTGRRSTVAVLGISKDITEQAGQLITTFWPLALTTVGFTLLLIWHFPRLKKPLVLYPRRVRSWVPLPAGIIFAIFCIRGGTQLKPLRVNHAFEFPPVQIGHLTLNSTFTFLKSATVQHLEPRTYFNSEAALKAALPPQTAPKPALPLPETPQNVVILILESFAAEYTGIYNPYPGYTPFLDSIGRQGLVFGHHYANGRRSIEALPAILAGIPSLMEEPYITSAYQANDIRGLGTELQKYGYTTSFFHGATNGSMGFSNFSRMAGIQHYYGLNEYPNPEPDYDGSWGIYDEPYLQYFARTLTATKQPFFATAFTLSSHPPYSIPQHLAGKFPKGSLDIHASIGYTDYALRKFFQTAEKQPWYPNTLFILTADHTQQTDQPQYHHIPGSFQVPLIFFHPQQKLPPADTAQVSQHADFPPTILHYLGRESPTWPFSRSLFNQNQPGKALLYTDNRFLMLQKPFAVSLPENGEGQIFRYPEDKALSKPLPKPEKEEQLLNQLKAYVQLYYNGLIENSWFKD